MSTLKHKCMNCARKHTILYANSNRMVYERDQN